MCQILKDNIDSGNFWVYIGESVLLVQCLSLDKGTNVNLESRLAVIFHFITIPELITNILTKYFKDRQ